MLVTGFIRNNAKLLNGLIGTCTYGHEHDAHAKPWYCGGRLGAFLADEAAVAASLMQTFHVVCDQMLQIW